MAKLKKYNKGIQDIPSGARNFVRLYTDGSCHPNPGGPAGWAFVALKASPDGSFKRFEGSGGELISTNNRAEMLALIHGLRFVYENFSGVVTVEVVTDSDYLAKGVAEWRLNWKKRSFFGVKNSDLWIEIDRLVDQADIYMSHIRGHQGEAENEVCDRLAGEARLKIGL